MIKFSNNFFPQWLAVLCAFSVVLVATATTAQTSPSSDAVLSVAEDHFKHLKARDYPAVWQTLTAKSQADIVTHVTKSIAKQGIAPPERDAVTQDFAQGGPLAKAYWDAYLASFNPDMVLEQCVWTLGKIGKEEAVILLKYKKSDKPAELQLRLENGVWKVGLEETFGMLRWLPR